MTPVSERKSETHELLPTAAAEAVTLPDWGPPFRLPSHHPVGIFGLQDLRGQQSELLLVPISSRYAVYGNLELRAMDHPHRPQSSFHFAHAFPTLGILRCEMTSLSRAKSLLRIYASKVASGPGGSRMLKLMAFTLAAAFLFAIASIIIGRFTATPSLPPASPQEPLDS
jgi:hypothetical protein